MVKIVFLCFLCLTTLASAWTGCTGVMGVLGEDVCVSLKLSGSVFEMRGTYGKHSFAIQRDLHDLEPGPTFEACTNPGVPGVKLCLHGEHLVVQMSSSKGYGLQGCFSVSGRLFGAFKVTHSLGCVDLASQRE